MSQTKPRTWSVHLQTDEYGNPLWSLFREEAQTAMQEIEAIGDKIGGYFFAAPGRAQVDGEWVTVRWDFRWTSFVPAPQTAPEPDSEREDADEPVEEPAVAA